MLLESCCCDKQFIRKQSAQFQYFHLIFHRVTRFINNKKIFIKLFYYYKHLLFQKNLEIPCLEIYVESNLELVSKKEILLNKSVRDIFSYLHEITHRRREILLKIVFKQEL